MDYAVVRVIGAGSWSKYIRTIQENETRKNQIQLYGILNVVESKHGDTIVDVTKENAGELAVDYYKYCDYGNETVSLLCMLPYE